MIEPLVRHLAAQPSPIRRVLDVGCGSGGHTLELATQLPDARITGVDVSPRNIEIAQEAADRLGARNAVFVAADIRQFSAEPFDLVMAWDTLHLIPGDPEILLLRIASLVRSGGTLAATLPYRCTANAVLWMARRILRMCRSKTTDRILLAVGRRLHPSFDETLLRDRIPYAYLLPNAVDDAKLRRLLAHLSFRTSVVSEEPAIKFGKPRHHLLILTKAIPS